MSLRVCGRLHRQLPHGALEKHIRGVGVHTFYRMVRVHQKSPWGYKPTGSHCVEAYLVHCPCQHLNESDDRRYPWTQMLQGSTSHPVAGMEHYASSRVRII